MSIRIPSLLKDLSKEFIKTISDSEKTSDKIIELVARINQKTKNYADEIYNVARKETDSHANKIEIDLKPAAKAYLLISVVFKEGARFVTDKEVSWILTDSALALHRQAEQTLYDEVTLNINRAYKYEEIGNLALSMNIKSTEMKNKAKDLEYQIKTGSFKKLFSEVQTEYKSIYEDSTGKNLLSVKRPSEIQEPRITPSQINIENGSLSNSNGEYDWWIYLKAKDDVMKQINSVTYTLHPTFPRANTTVKDPSEGFKLDATGFNEFQIKVEINLKDGEVITKYHWLDLGINKSKDMFGDFYMPDAFTGG